MKIDARTGFARRTALWVWSLSLPLGVLSSACGSSSSDATASSAGASGVAAGNAGGSGAAAGGAGGNGVAASSAGSGVAAASAGANSGGTGGANVGDSTGGSGHDANGGVGGTPALSTGGSTGLSIQCSASASAGLTSNPEVQRTVQGTNGTFVDSCDAQGNLTDYSCESMQTCTYGNPQPDPLPLCISMNTGKVISQTYDCSGHCVNGTCAAHCPTFTDLLSYIAVDSATGAATFENQTGHRRYVCQLEFDFPNDTYDCKADPTVGLVVKMVSQGLKTFLCTGGDFGAFGVGATDAGPIGGERCEYECVIPPG